MLTPSVTQMAVTNHSCHNYTEMTCHQADALCTTQTQKNPHCHWVLWSVSWYVVENTLVQTGFKLLKEIIFRSKQIQTVLMFRALKTSDVSMRFSRRNWSNTELFFVIFYAYSSKCGDFMVLYVKVSDVIHVLSPYLILPPLSDRTEVLTFLLTPGWFSVMSVQCPEWLVPTERTIHVQNFISAASGLQCVCSKHWDVTDTLLGLTFTSIDGTLSL